VEMTILVVGCGTGVGIGLIGLLRVLSRDRWQNRSAGQMPGTRRARSLVSTSTQLRRVLLVAAPTVVVLVVTRWPAAAVLTACILLGVPALVRVTGRNDSMARTEAMAVWTELLRDTLAAASGLSQAIVVTAPLAPEAIRNDAARLASRLSNGTPANLALRMFADDLADPSADLVVCALILATSARAQRLVDLLGALAESMREEVSMRLRVESGRASARSGVRTIVFFSLGFAAVLFVIARAYLAPFGTAGGQLALLASGGLDMFGILLMIRLVNDRGSSRLLEGLPRDEAVA
jgi:tight adherence protein B